MKTINIEGCINCPVIDQNDFCDGWTCRLEEKKNSDAYTIILEDKNFLPINPDWCPLKEQTILLKLIE